MDLERKETLILRYDMSLALDQLNNAMMFPCPFKNYSPSAVSILMASVDPLSLYWPCRIRNRCRDAFGVFFLISSSTDSSGSPFISFLVGFTSDFGSRLKRCNTCADQSLELDGKVA
jgi:hypothetical protein